MYQVGDLIIYGNKGVCEIADISTIDIGEKDRLYYILNPRNDKNGKVFAPVDNGKTQMRRILSREEAEKLMNSIDTIEELSVTDERQREQNYRAAVNSGDCIQWVRVIRTLTVRNKERLARGKKVTAMDKKYCKLAEDNLYPELAESLGMQVKAVKDYVNQKLEESQTADRLL